MDCKPSIPKYVELVFDRTVGSQSCLYVLVGIMIHIKRLPRKTAINTSLMATLTFSFMISSCEEEEEEEEGGFLITMFASISLYIYDLSLYSFLFCMGNARGIALL